MENDKAPRIHMGRILSPSSEAGSGNYIMRPGRAVKDMLEQLARVVPLLEANSLRQNDSLYADEAGALAEFSAGILKGCPNTDIEGTIERIIDMRPFLDIDSERAFPRRHSGPLDMRFDRSFISPDAVPTAGMILNQERRKIYDNTVGGRYLAIGQAMESYLLAAAVMRTAGIPAYVATSVMPAEEGEEHKPLLAVLDGSRGSADALLTFDLVRVHPPVGSVEIISDGALWGLGNVMRATNKVKLLMSEISMIGLAGSEIEPEELGQRIKDIARSLFECHKVWPGSHFIPEALGFLRDEMYATTKFLMQARIEGDWENFAVAYPELARSPALLEQTVAQDSAAQALSVERMALEDMAVMAAPASRAGSGASDPNVN